MTAALPVLWAVARLGLMGLGGLSILHHFFGGHDDHGSDPDASLRLAEILGQGSPSTPPLTPGGSSALGGGADGAAGAYQGAQQAGQANDGDLDAALKRILATDADARSKIEAIDNEIKAKAAAIVADPKLASDPAVLRAFVSSLDGRLGQVQQILDNAKADHDKHGEALKDIGDKYKQGAPDKSGQGQGGSGQQGNQGSQGSGSVGNGQGGGSQGGQGDPSGGQAGGNGLIDPLAGLGGMGGANPLEMLGPELAGLGSAIPAVGGLAGAPLDALGALAGLGGLGHSGFVDDEPRHHDREPGFVDDDPEKKTGGNGKHPEHPEFTDAGNQQQTQQEQQQPGGKAAVVDPGVTGAGAVPAANTGGDPAKVVQLPDGLPPVTASTDKAANLVRGVLNGQSLTDAAKAAGIDLAAPGTPVHPADPNHLTPSGTATHSRSGFLKKTSV
jgi:hypothetical protein